MNNRTYLTIIGILLIVGGLTIMITSDNSLFSMLGGAFIGGGIGLLSFWLMKPKKKILNRKF